MNTKDKNQYQVMRQTGVGYALFVKTAYAPYCWQQITKWYSSIGTLKRYANKTNKYPEDVFTSYRTIR